MAKSIKLKNDIYFDIDAIAKSGKKLGFYLPRIIWTNEKPNENMNTNTQIKLSDDNYDLLIWIYCYNINSANTLIQKSSICLKGASPMMNIIGYATGIKARRILDWSDNKTYIARAGKDDAGNDNNSYCIPLFCIAMSLYQ